MRLWYAQPATGWEREALPIGAGALGAMVFGGIPTDRLALNEKTLWTGGPGSAGGYRHGDWPEPGRPGAVDAVRRRLDTAGELPPEQVAAALGQPRQGYGAYQPLGDLLLDVAGAAGPAAVTGYRRSLDLTEAVATVSYTAAGVHHRREYFASYPGRVVAGRLAADRPGAVTVTLRLRPGPAGATVTACPAGRLTLRGALADNGLRYEAQLRVTATGGEVTGAGDRVTVTAADEVTFVLAAGTDYAATYPGYRGADPHRRVTATADAAAGMPYHRLRAGHVADYRELAGRATLDLAAPVPDLPTDRLLAQARGGGAALRALTALHFAYGRYLLVAASRPGSLPANLQGVWNDSPQPAWHADYHLNVNFQMCYWPAHVTHLAETAAPVHDFVEALVPPGRVSAARMFGAPGWVVHDETTPWGFTGVHDWPTAFWFPEAAAWLCRHLWEHYRFTEDEDFLRRRAWPVLVGAAELWLATLHPAPDDGALLASPSYSPEHGPFTAGAAMSQQLVRDLFTTVRAAAEILGERVPAGLGAALARLDPGLRVGRWGQLQEWRTDRDDPAEVHRHVSHLYAVYPAGQVCPLATPALARAAAVSLRVRGDGGTGWGRAWRACLWARLRDGDAAHRALAGLLAHSTLPNLLDTHPPYQLDGNLGAVAAVAELLVQSHTGVIDVLPALPAAWPAGSVTGLRARGGVTVDVSWRDRAAVGLAITPDRATDLTVRCGLLPAHPLRDGQTGREVPLAPGRLGGYRLTAPGGRRLVAGAGATS